MELIPVPGLAELADTGLEVIQRHFAVHKYPSFKKYEYHGRLSVANLSAAVGFCAETNCKRRVMRSLPALTLACRERHSFLKPRDREREHRKHASDRADALAAAPAAAKLGIEPD